MNPLGEIPGHQDWPVVQPGRVVDPLQDLGTGRISAVGPPPPTPPPTPRILHQVEGMANGAQFPGGRAQEVRLLQADADVVAQPRPR